MAAITSIKDAKRIVIKIGSALLVDAESGTLRLKWLKSLAADIASLRQAGKDVIVVSSGSIALGRRVLKLPSGALHLEHSQAAAAVGQIKLARAYEEVLSPYGINTGQVLLTLDDSEDRRRYLNSRATFASLLKFGTVPIVNENDTVATDEIRYGDNDRLAAQVAAMAGADVLVLLSDVDGLYTKNPKQDVDAKHLDVVHEITLEIEAMAGDAGSASAKGGMKTKIMAAKMAMKAGCGMVIALGEQENPISAIMNGAKSTWFLADTDPNSARKNWISGIKSRGKLTLDDGAINALRMGKSLLPAGVTLVEGDFQRGDPVQLIDSQKRDIGQGVSGYDVSEARKIAGCQSAEIKELLGYGGRSVVIHRDDLVVRVK